MTRIERKLRNISRKRTDNPQNKRADIDITRIGEDYLSRMVPAALSFEDD